MPAKAKGKDASKIASITTVEKPLTQEQAKEKPSEQMPEKRGVEQRAKVMEARKQPLGNPHPTKLQPR